MNPKMLFLAIALAAGPVAAPGLALAAKPLIYTPALSNAAAGGYDVVAYFTAGRPMPGVDSFKTEWKGATWKFSSAANLAKFKANPAAYAPQYGGYCAWAVSQGYTAKGDPQHWKIVGGKLYLNYNSEVQTKWNKDIPGFIRKGDSNWPTVLK
ncbi:MAG: YHS domain-containing protein [Caulobacteraceae bacterium]|nr:YHS domain-containing protein [Caulobacteraceae bacterium]